MSAPSPAPGSIPPTTPPPATVYPFAVQSVLACALAVAFVFLGWRVWQAQSNTRPTELQPYRIDLNRASASELQQLPGVGPRTAEMLLAQRESTGGFQTTDDLKAVKSLGEKKRSRLQPWVTVEDPVEPSEDGERLSRKSPETTPGMRGAKATPDQKIDLNSATPEALQKLPGIGAVLAQRIVTERDRKPFEKIEDLRRVSGIGVKTLEKLRPYVSLGDR